MKLWYRMLSLLIVLMFTGSFAIAQEKQLTKKYKQEVIETLSQLIIDNYVFPDVARLTEEHLKAQLNKGYFDQFNDGQSFARALTESVQSINKDKHMRIRPKPQFEAPIKSADRRIEEQLNQLNQSRRANAGFNTVKVLEGNVGYLDLRGFAGMEIGKPVADAYMKLMSRTDAVIIDVSKNGGGSPDMVQYLCSYFFDKKLHLNSLYWRRGNSTEEYWTLDEVGGVKMSDVPLFIITSSRTFSAAEEFSYNMQTQKRATLVGQTTGGGANPGRSFPIDDNLMVFIPTGKAINPITKTNWEGVGVVPEVSTDVESAFDKTHELAQQAAETYRKNRNEKFSLLLKELESNLKNYVVGKSEQALLQCLTSCNEANLLREGDINRLGYEYLMEQKVPSVAECIFKANTILYPDSPNVFDSYAEALMATGNVKASVENYQKAFDIAVSNDNPDAALFKKNLDGARQKLKDMGK